MNIKKKNCIYACTPTQNILNKLHQFMGNNNKKTIIFEETNLYTRHEYIKWEPNKFIY